MNDTNENKQRILHVFNDPKFSIEYFKFLLKNNFDLSSHSLFHYRTTIKFYPEYISATTHSKSFFSIFPNLKLLLMLFRAEKIIIHCLASPALIFYLYCFPQLLKKCFWVIWGKDVYFYQMLPHIRFYHRVYEHFRKKVIKNMPNIVGDKFLDFPVVRTLYGNNSKIYNSFSYPSNLFKDRNIVNNISDHTTILVGNSADPSNNHLELFLLLEKYKEKNITIICPLSYGDMKYAAKVSVEGKRIFRDKFIPLPNLLPLKDYEALLDTIDIGLFAHRRQQAFGNIISLLSIGKKIYLRQDITTWNCLLHYGVKVHDVNNFDLSKISKDESILNSKIVKNVFSEKNLVHQWQRIFKAEFV